MLHRWDSLQDAWWARSEYHYPQIPKSHIGIIIKAGMKCQVRPKFLHVTYIVSPIASAPGALSLRRLIMKDWVKVSMRSRRGYNQMPFTYSIWMLHEGHAIWKTCSFVLGVISNTRILLASWNFSKFLFVLLILCVIHFELPKTTLFFNT